MASKLISIPQRFNANQREAIGNAIVERIRQRTAAGLDINNEPFAPYKQSYRNTDEFQVAKSGTVNLRLTGDMMADLEVLSHGPGFIKIGFADNSTNRKADWIESPTGQKAGKQTPRRFVGISNADLSPILARFETESVASATNARSSFISAFVRNLISG